MIRLRRKPDYGKIARLEHEVLDGGPTPRGDHPYGDDAEGLITEVRVEMEKELRERELPMPSLVDRLAGAESEARRRWPDRFTIELEPERYWADLVGRTS